MSTLQLNCNHFPILHPFPSLDRILPKEGSSCQTPSQCLNSQKPNLQIMQKGYEETGFHSFMPGLPFQDHNITLLNSKSSQRVQHSSGTSRTGHGFHTLSFRLYENSYCSFWPWSLIIFILWPGFLPSVSSSAGNSGYLSFIQPKHKCIRSSICSTSKA